MASPAGTHSTKMFTGGARHATAELVRATRAAKRAAGAVKGAEAMPTPEAVDWYHLNANAWKRCGAMSVFRMRGSGTALFTGGRDV
eukprot:5827904-Pleurochrysis_carterae.AAC.1